MSISDRLDQIAERHREWYGDRGRHTPAPDTELWRLADHPDESMDHYIVREDVPMMLYALRAVLDLHEGIDGLHTRTGRRIKLCAECERDGDWKIWPCPTVKAVEAALGEGA